MDERVDNRGIVVMSRMGESAEAYFRAGECCAEAVVHATIDQLAPATPPEAAIMVQGLCGGLGNKRATCGVFTGGAVAMAIAARADGREVDAKRIKQLTSRFQELLEQEWGGQICSGLLKSMGMSNWNRSQCRQLTRRGAEVLVDVLEAEGLLGP